MECHQHLRHQQNCLWLEERKHAVAIIDIGSENQFFALKRSDQLVSLWYHDNCSFVPRHIPILIAYCRRSKTGRWKGLLDSCIWLDANLPVTGYFTSLSKVSCMLQNLLYAAYAHVYEKHILSHLICQDSRDHASQLTSSIWQFGIADILVVESSCKWIVSAKVLKVLFT